MIIRLMPPLLFAGLVLPAAALAHTVWLTPAGGGPDGWQVRFGGHAGRILAFAPEKLKTVEAFDAGGTKLSVTRRSGPDGVRLQTSGAPSVITAHFDNGIFTNRSDGPSVQKPLDQVPTGISATRAIKYHKTIAAWTPMVTRPVGQPFEVVPLSAAQPIAGEPMKLRVLIDGKPAAGIKIARNEEGADAVTDAQGIAGFTPVRGFNKLWSGRRTAVEGDPTHTQVSIEYSLGFDAK